MKRTKETFYRYHPNPVDRDGVSGCREFDGEDLEYDSRTQYYKTQQKNWIEDHQSQKDQERDREKFEETLYAKQVHEVTRMRQMLEEDQKKKKNAIQCSIMEENQILAQQKKDREAKEKQERLQWERSEVNDMLERGKAKPYRPAF